VHVRKAPSHVCTLERCTLPVRYFLSVGGRDVYRAKECIAHYSALTNAPRRLARERSMGPRTFCLFTLYMRHASL